MDFQSDTTNLVMISEICKPFVYLSIYLYIYILPMPKQLKEGLPGGAELQEASSLPPDRVAEGTRASSPI